MAKVDAYFFNEVSSSKIFPSPVPRNSLHEASRFLNGES